MDKPIKIVENFANKIIFLVVIFKINFLLKFLSFKFLYKIAYMLSLVFIFFNKKTSNVIAKYQVDCYGESFNSTYFNNLFYNTLLLCTYPYYSKEKVAKLINNDEIKNFFSENDKVRFNIGGLHFFNFLSITSISEFFYDRNKKIFASFVLGENKILSNFIKHIKKRFHYDYHYTYNLATDVNGKEKLMQLYHTDSCNFFIFCDVGFKKKKDNINILINEKTLSFNRGYSDATKNFIDCENVIIYLTMNKNYTFQHHYLYINSAEDFYNTEFKLILKENKELWQLWFFNPIFE